MNAIALGTLSPQAVGVGPQEKDRGVAAVTAVTASRTVVTDALRPRPYHVGMPSFWRTGVSARARAAIAVVAQLAYPIAFAALDPFLGDGIFSLAVIPVGLAAWAFGVGWGTLSIAFQLAARAFLVMILRRDGSAWPDATTAVLLVAVAIWFGFVRSLRIDLMRRAREAEALATATGLLAAGTAAGETLHGILSAAMSVVPSTVASFMVPADEGESLRVAAIVGANPEWLGRTYSASAGVSGRAWRTAATVRIADVSRDPDYLSWTPSTRSALAVPVARAGELLGLIYFEDTRAARYDERDERLMRSFADHAAVALESDRIGREIERLALFDTLTGLPNRNHFVRSVRAAIARATPAQEIFAVVLVDIDRFNEINDTFGFGFGDELIRLVGARFQADANPADELARLDGNEFALLVRSDPLDALRIAETMRHALEIPFEIEGQPVALTGTVGISFFPEHGLNDVTLLRHAHIAMHVGKSTGAGATIYATAIDAHSPARVALGPELRRAIADGQLGVHYQPIVPLQPGKAFGAEALVRWTHPARGPMSPAELIPIAEGSGLMKLLTDNVLAQATADARAWGLGERDFDIAVNVSMRNLRDPNFVNSVRQRLARSNLDPARLTLEITESVVMADPDQTLVILRHFRELGVCIAIDDFGTGYSSLSYLGRLPVDALKIDRSFVAGLLRDAASESIVRATIDLAHALGLAVVAEGVETQEQLVRLRDLGCDRAQGFGIGRPMVAPDLAAWVNLEARRYSAS